ncbi:ATP-binding protein [Paraburkholderia nemoris]|uniref:ATP-binding protein n=1 Tax=Paraburkholderia nemoris TaxID=2793076 RepID=UPI0038BCC6D1
MDVFYIDTMKPNVPKSPKSAAQSQDIRTEGHAGDTLQPGWFGAQDSRGNAQPAEYRDRELNPAFAANPCALCIPAAVSYEESAKALVSTPPERSPDFMSLPAQIRAEHANTFRDLFVPCDCHVLSFMRLIDALRESYRFRNLESPEFQRHLWDIVRAGSARAVPRMNRTGGAAGGLIVIGPTGSGKTSLIDRVVENVGDFCRVHTTIGGRPCLWPQIPILRVSAAGRTTPKQLAFAIAVQLDGYIGADCAKSMDRTTDYVYHISRFLSSNLVGVLVIEDGQLWTSIESGLRKGMLGLLVGVMEITGIPVINVGTYRLQRVLETYSSDAEKLMALGRLDIPPVSGDEMFSLCQAFWNERMTDGPSAMPDWMPAAVLTRTAGIRRYVRMLMMGLMRGMTMDGILKLERGYFESCTDVVLGGYAEAIRTIGRAYSGQRVTSELLLKYEEYIDPVHYRERVKSRRA